MNFKISDFWIRIVAFLIDGVILGIFGFLITIPFSDFFISIGSNGIFIGFVISLLYFSIMNSKIGKGKTLGKIAMKIQVVDKEGNFLNFEKSLLRTFILLFPYFFVNYNIPNIPEDSIYSIIKAQILVDLLIGIILIYILNKSTRQSIHDIIINSYVVDLVKLEEKKELNRIKIYPFYILGAIVLIFMAITVYNLSSPRQAMANVNSVHKELKKIEGVINAIASRNTSTFYGQDENNTTESFTCVLFVKELPKKFNEIEQLDVVKNAVMIILDNYKEKERLDFISVKLVRGYNIGIARSNKSYSISKTPDEWLEIIN